jgi:hypothetical protein
MHGRLRAAGSWIREHRLLCVILLAAFALRLAPILWGVPLRPEVRGFHPDEPKVFGALAAFPEIYGSTRPFSGYGTALQYLLGIVLLPLKAWVVWIGERPDEYKIMAQLASRLSSVLLGVGCIPLLYLLGTRLFDRATATAAAALLAVSFYHTMNSAVGTLDVPLAFLVLVNVLVCFDAFEKPGTGRFALLGICTGLLVGTKLSGLMFFAVPATLLLAHRLRPAGDAHGLEAGGMARGRDLAVYGVCAALVFAVTNPQVFVDFEKYAAWWIKESREVHSQYLGSLADLARRWQGETSRAVGWPVAILAVVGAVLAGEKRRPEKLALAAFVVVYYAALQWSLRGRYVIAVAPILCLFAARGAMAIGNLPRTWARPAGVAIVAVAFMAGLHSCLWGVYLRLYDTRPEATRFIEGSVARGATLGLVGAAETRSARSHRWRYPEIDFDRYEETSPLRRPDVLVFSSLDYHRILDMLRSGALGPDYSLPEELQSGWYRSRAPAPEMFRLYDEVLVQEKDYRLLQTFRVEAPVPLEFSPPEILIYVRRRAAS